MYVSNAPTVFNSIFNIYYEYVIRVYLKRLGTVFTSCCCDPSVSLYGSFLIWQVFTSVWMVVKQLVDAKTRAKVTRPPSSFGNPATTFLIWQPVHHLPNLAGGPTFLIRQVDILGSRFASKLLTDIDADCLPVRRSSPPS